MGFDLYSGNKLERLAEKFAEVVYRTPPADPLAPETVIVQTQGMAAWLKLYLGAHSPVAANLDTPFPVKFVNRILAQAFPHDFAADCEASDPELLSWRIDRILAERPEAYPELRRYLTGENRALRRRQLAVRIAGLFDQYQIYRPELPEAWRNGVREPRCEWQGRLYAEVMGARRGRDWYFRAFRELAAWPGRKLPERVSVFGVGTMPPVFLQFFVKLSRFCDVAFFYLNPCREYWEYLESPREAARRPESGALPADGNPLLAAWGTQGREFFRLIASLPEVCVPADGELFEPFVAGGDRPDGYRDWNVLRALQQDILAMYDRHGEGDGELSGRPLRPEPGDRSVTIHNCHSCLREIEVLHDQLIALLRDNPDLQARDIIVMTPDINAYAAGIDAVFGQGPLQGRYAIADRSLRQGSRIADAFLQLLALPGGRFEASAVLELLEEPAIRRRFGMDDAALETVRRWVAAAGIRWGIDGEDRKRRCEVAFDEYAWRQGLDRLLMGFLRELPPENAAPEDLLGVPFLGGEGQAELLGNLVDFAEKLFRLKRELARERTPEAWRELLDRTVGDFFLADRDNLEELAALRMVLERFARQSERSGYRLPMPVEVAAEWLEEALTDSADSARFLRGRITFCSLVPMRSIPMPVVALLGLNDGAFPRRDLRLGFNLIASELRPCDRSRQLEDRYLFLEAVLSARRYLLLFYQGQTARGRDVYPPAVPLGELMDYLERGFGVREIRHKLQPFDFDYFDPEREGEGYFSFSMENFEAAAALRQSLTGPAPVSEPAAALPAPPALPAADETVALEDLERALENLPAWFLRRRAGLVFYGHDPLLIEDSEPFEADALERSRLTARIGRWTLDGFPGEAQYGILRRSGRLPVGEPGRQLFEALYGQVRTIPEVWWTRLRSAEKRTVQLECGGVRLDGRIDASADGGEHYFLAYSSFKGKYALRFYLRHLVLTLAAADGGGKPVTSYALTFEADGVRERTPLPPMARDAAAAALAQILRIFRDGGERPLPLFAATSYAYATASGDRREKWKAARRIFVGDWNRGGEAADPAIRRCFDAEALDDPGLLEVFASLAETVFRPFSAGEDGR